MHKPENPNLWTDGCVNPEMLMEHTEYFTCLPVDTRALGINLYNIYATGTKTAYHCLIDVKKKDIERENEKLKEKQKKDTVPSQGNSKKDGQSEYSSTLPSSSSSSSSSSINSSSSPQHANPLAQAFSEITPANLFSSTCRWVYVDGDGTVPAFSAANDRLGSVARFELPGVAHMEILYDKRMLNILAAVLHLDMPYPDIH